MKIAEMIDLIEWRISILPERMSGNEHDQIIAQWLEHFLEQERDAIVGSLRKYLSFRKTKNEQESQCIIGEARLWMALDISERLRVTELYHDIQLLFDDVRQGKALLPVHQSLIARYLESMRYYIHDEKGKNNDIKIKKI